MRSLSRGAVGLSQGDDGTSWGRRGVGSGRGGWRHWRRRRSRTVGGRVGACASSRGWRTPSRGLDLAVVNLADGNTTSRRRHAASRRSFAAHRRSFTGHRRGHSCRGLNLAVGNLADRGATSRRRHAASGRRHAPSGRATSTLSWSGSLGAGVLDLSIRDLLDLSRSLNLAGSLDLTITYLRDGALAGVASMFASGRLYWASRHLRVLVTSSRGVNLTSSGLRGSRTGDSTGRCLNLTIGNLGDSTRSRDTRGWHTWGRHPRSGHTRRLELAVDNLTGRRRATRWVANIAGTLDLYVDSLALGRPFAVIQVVEFARATLVEDLRRAEGQISVLTSGEARGSEGPSLRGTVELELEVVGNVTGTALLVGKNTILEMNSEVTPLKITLRGGSVGSLSNYLELAIVRGTAARRGSRSLRSSRSGGREASEGNSVPLHIEGIEGAESKCVDETSVN